MGADITVTGDSLHLKPGGTPLKDRSIATYSDHRMAMAFAPLALRTSLYIEDAGVVSKSYPDFWEDLQELGFVVEKV
jgi:3-phosphoshikimate 1-carboxyvinyltransferase